MGTSKRVETLRHLGKRADDVSGRHEPRERGLFAIAHVLAFAGAGLIEVLEEIRERLPEPGTPGVVIRNMAVDSSDYGTLPDESLSSEEPWSRKPEEPARPEFFELDPQGELGPPEWMWREIAEVCQVGDPTEIAQAIVETPEYQALAVRDLGEPAAEPEISDAELDSEVLREYQREEK